MYKWFDKHLDFLALSIRKDTSLIALEGTVRSTKTVVAIQSFFYRVYNSDGYLHLIAGRDLDSINNNILNCDMGLLKLFSEYCKLKKEQVGSYYIEMQTPKGLKKILLCGYSNKKKWQKVLGGSIECVFVDEVNIADKQFIDECFARQVSFDAPFTIWTLNGDEPTHWIYTEYINRCNIVGKCPSSIRADMGKAVKEPNWFYMHWVMEDNPIMTPEKIRRAKSIYPVGSYYYTIKILGERGVPGDLIFVDYIDGEKCVQPIDISKYGHFGIGADIGGNKAQNSFTLSGFTFNYDEVAVVDKLTFQQVGYKEKTEKLIAFVRRCLANKINVEYIAVDSAESNYISDLQALFRAQNLPPVIASYKATIKERIDLIILLLARCKLLFNDTEAGRDALTAYKLAKWADGKKGQEREDKNQWFNDVMDSVEYSLTRHMRKLLNSVKIGDDNNGTKGVV